MRVSLLTVLPPFLGGSSDLRLNHRWFDFSVTLPLSTGFVTVKTKRLKKRRALETRMCEPRSRGTISQK